MTRTIVILMTLMSVLPSDGSSQAVPSLGHRIRIKQVDGTVLTGRLATLSPENDSAMDRFGRLGRGPCGTDRSLGDQPGPATEIRQILWDNLSPQPPSSEE